MTQFNLDTPINPATKSGTTLADDLSGTSKWRDALHSCHKGSSAPSYAQAGMIWVDDTSDPSWGIYFHDGTDDILVATVNTTTNVIDLVTLAGSQILTNKTIDSADNTITIDTVEEFNGKGLKYEYLDLGDWNMDTTANNIIGPGSFEADEDKIITVDVTIRDDNGFWYKLEGPKGSGGTAGGAVYWRDTLGIDISRVTGGFFDDVLFDSTSYNRGWILITYYE